MPEPLLEQQLTARVMRCELLGAEVHRIVLSLPRPLFVHQAGQYLLLELVENWVPLSIASVAIPNIDGAVQKESSNPAQDFNLELHIKIGPGGQPDSVKSLLMPGASVNLRYPFGECVLKCEVESLLLIAGGTGFSQAKALLEAALAAAVPNIKLIWLAKRTDELYLHDWLIGLAQQHPALVFEPCIIDHTCVSQADYKRVFEDCVQRLGFTHLQQVQTYLAGGPPMVKLLADHLKAMGFDSEKVRSDVFDLNL